MKDLNQKGTSPFFVLFAVAVVVVVGVVCYRVLNNTQTETPQYPVAENQQDVPEQFKTKADVQQAHKALDNTAIDSNVNPNQLDSDLESLL